MDIRPYINVHSILPDKLHCSSLHKSPPGTLMKIKSYVHFVRFNYINLYFGHCQSSVYTYAPVPIKYIVWAANIVSVKLKMEINISNSCSCSGDSIVWQHQPVTLPTQTGIHQDWAQTQMDTNNQQCRLVKMYRVLHVFKEQYMCWWQLPCVFLSNLYFALLILCNT